jgi:hypothetical protein
MTPPVRASATADPTLWRDRWRITVTGYPPFPFTRVYHIDDVDEGRAAMEGIRRFVAEFEGQTPSGRLILH